MLKILLEIIKLFLSNSQTISEEAKKLGNKKTKTPSKNVTPRKRLVSIEEILKGAKLQDQPEEIQKNLDILSERVSWIREKWGKPFTVTSGLRTMEDHLRIYKEKAAKKQKPFKDGVFDESKVPKKSRHLYGQAVDIYDPGLLITKWLKDNPSILEEAELWCEEGNSNWVHFQIVPPKSGNRWFLP